MKYGGQIMMQGNEPGQIKEGYLAGMLLFEGDASANVKILQDKPRIPAIMKEAVVASGRLAGRAWRRTLRRSAPCARPC